MTLRKLVAVLVSVLMGAACVARPAEAGKPTGGYKVLQPIQQDNLTIFPVVAAATHDTSQFLTLDEGIRSGEVVVSEMGRALPMVRRPGPVPPSDSAQVNRLVLVNNSRRPLILLAGEIVTGGKQDRVVGSDRIVLPKSEPVDLSVFCVEPGRWTATSGDTFGGFTAQMAQPSVRKEAMANRDQAKVWSEVGRVNDAMVAATPNVSRSTSYARNMGNPEVAKQVDKVAGPLSRSSDGLMRQLRDRKAVGVVVAINGRLEWVDLFASEALLQKYWPKLVRSYAAESLTNHDSGAARPEIDDAQRFLDTMSGEREISQTEPDVYRETEAQGHGWKAFRLTSLLPDTGFDLHIAKMTTGKLAEPVGLMRRQPVE